MPPSRITWGNFEGAVVLNQREQFGTIVDPLGDALLVVRSATDAVSTDLPPRGTE